jgi:hypothetical protein
MAPFVDVNNNGTYEPLAGDYPKMKGHQMLWWIMNDNGPVHNVSGTAPLNVEIKMSVYAYARRTAADNIIFYEYEVTNRSTATLSNFRLGISTDSDLGSAWDDYTGFDSARRMGIMYNGKIIDGNGGPGEYGSRPPAMGITMLELPDDLPASYAPAGSFGAYGNTPGGYDAAYFYNHLRMTYPHSRYGFDVDSECVGNHVYGDRRFVIAGNEFSFAPGQTKKMATALVVAANAGGCPNMSFAGISNAADTAWKLYKNPPATTAIPEAPGTLSLRIYPNPATNTLYIETPGAADGSLRIYDGLGRQLVLPQTRTANRISMNTAGIAAGIYTLQYGDGSGLVNHIFIKE